MLCMVLKSFDAYAAISTPFSNHIQAIIFDCDGVLVDTEYLKFLGWQKALASFDIELSIEEYKVVAGHSSKKIIEMLQEIKQIAIPEETMVLRRAEYRKIQELGVPPIKEMVEFALWVAQNKSHWGIKLGVASSASRNEIVINLKQVGLEHIFDLIVSATDDLDDYHDATGKNKPKPYVYLEAAKRLNVPPECCLVFEDTEAGIAAASSAGMVTVAIPNWLTAEQNFSKANTILGSVTELSIKVSNTADEVPFKKDEYLEQNQNTIARSCLQEFKQKGGVVQCIESLTDATTPKIRLNRDDAVYPICSGGFCRSQAMWGILQSLGDQIILFPPHAARAGWDPYNGQVNRYKNYAQESVSDEFNAFFGIEKAQRFGFENASEWKSIEESPSEEGLKLISQFYNLNYFGPHSSWNGQKGKKRVYIAFSSNAHVILYRLNQANDSLKDVMLIAIESEDLITYPPAFLNTASRSTIAYEYFTNLLKQIFDFSVFKDRSS